MNRKRLTLVVAAVALVGGCKSEKKAETPSEAAGASGPIASARILTMIGDSASTIEGLAEHGGKLYTADWKDGAVYRIDPAAGVEKVGQLPVKQGGWILGLAADAEGNVYAAMPATGVVYRIAAARLGAKDFRPAKDATEFVTGARGANGIAFDRNGHLFISGGDQNVVYHVGPQGGKAMVFAKDYATMTPDTTIPVRPFVTNGMAFDSKGNVYTANTGSGEVQRIEVKPDYTAGAVTSVVKDPRLIGADGLLIDDQDTIWLTANYGNTFAKVAPDGQVTILFADSTSGANVLRFPAELKRIGNEFYFTNLNFNAGANATQSQMGATVAKLLLK